MVLIWNSGAPRMLTIQGLHSFYILCLFFLAHCAMKKQASVLSKDIEKWKETETFSNKKNN